jgi:hypothetical protein
VQSNKRAISRHGWQPLNRGLLKSPEVLKTKVVMTRETTPTPTTTPQEIVPAAAAITTPISPSHATVLSNIKNKLSTNSFPKSLNLTPGYAGDFVTRMLQYAIKNKRNTKDLFKRYKDGKTLHKSLAQQDNKGFTAGSLFKANRVAIDSGLLEYTEEKEPEAVRKQHASISKHTNKFLTNKKEWSKFWPARRNRKSCTVHARAQGCCKVEEEKG